MPARLFNALRAPPLLLMLNVPRDARVRHLVNIYCGLRRGGHEADDGSASVETGSGLPTHTRISTETVAELGAAVESLRKRRGGEATTRALEWLRAGDYEAVAHAALDYYDELYDEYAASSSREHVVQVDCSGAGTAEDALRVRAAAAAWVAPTPTPTSAPSTGSGVRVDVPSASSSGKRSDAACDERALCPASSGRGAGLVGLGLGLAAVGVAGLRLVLVRMVRGRES